MELIQRDFRKEPLIGALSDEDNSVISSASDALRRITNTALGKDPKKWS